MNARAIRAAVAATAIFVSGFAGQAFALDAYWHGVLSDVWNDGLVPPSEVSNWYSDPPPNGVNPRKVPNGTAIFANGAQRTSIRITKRTTVGRMRFTPDAPGYVFRVLRNKFFFLNGLGLINQASTTPRIVVLSAATFVVEGEAHFMSGGATSVEIRTFDRGILQFLGESAGGNASVINQGGWTVFTDGSSAQDMTIRNRDRGRLNFHARATGDRARLFNEKTGQIRFYSGGPAGDGVIPVGRIENNGLIWLFNRTLKVRRTFSHEAGGVLILDLHETGAGKVVAVTGTLFVHGRLVVRADAGARPGNYQIARAVRGRRIGKFSGVTLIGRNNLKARLAYGAKEVRLIVERK